ncbi:MAG: hypothetical protein ABL890_00900 [Candidatus Peribacteraceae bacterium]
MNEPLPIHGEKQTEETLPNENASDIQLQDALAVFKDFENRLRNALSAALALTASSPALDELRFALAQQLLAISQVRKGQSAEVSAPAISELLAAIDSGQPSIHLVETLKSAMRELLQEFINTYTSLPSPILPGLPVEQERILSDLLKIPEDDLSAAQVQIDMLIGQRLTEQLTRSIINLMKRKNWRFQCPKSSCGASSKLRWQVNSRYRCGGCVQFAHTSIDGKSIQHSGATTFQHWILISGKTNK